MSDQRKKIKKDVEKIDLHAADDLWGEVTADDREDWEDQEMYGLDDHLYGDDQYEEEYSEEDEIYDYEDEYYDETTSEGEYVEEEYAVEEEYEEEQEYEAVEETLEAVTLEVEAPPSAPPEVEQPPPEEVSIASEPFVCSAVIVHIGGMQQEVANAKLFDPQENTLVITDEAGNEEQVVFFEQLSCIHVSNLPSGISEQQKKSGSKEIVETIDGKTIKVSVLPEQKLESALICLSREGISGFPAVFIPTSSIKKRTPDRDLSDILLEKRFISKSMLQKAIREFEHLRNITLEKVIAQKTQIPLEQIVQTLKEGKEGPFMGMADEEILLFSGLVTEDIIVESVEYHEKFAKIELGRFLAHKGIVGEREVFLSLAELHNMTFIDLKGRKFSKDSLTSLPQGLIRNYEILPIAKKENTLIIATHQTDRKHFEDTVARAAKCEDIRYVLTPPSQIRKLITMLFGRRK